MMPDKEKIAAWFDEFNNNYFESSLPMPRLSCGKSRTRLGTMSCKRRRTSRGWENYDYTIRLSTYYEQSEEQLRTVLLHEMIHYYIAYKGISDDAPHGSAFRAMMHRLNARHGWHITVSSSCAKLQPATKETEGKPRLILAAETNDGRYMLSVVNPDYCRRMNGMIKRTPQITNHAWYVSHDPFFATFPTVRSLRGRLFSHDEYDNMTSQMKKIDVLN